MDLAIFHEKTKIQESIIRSRGAAEKMPTTSMFISKSKHVMLENLLYKGHGHPDMAHQRRIMISHIR